MKFLLALLGSIAMYFRELMALRPRPADLLHGNAFSFLDRIVFKNPLRRLSDRTKRACGIVLALVVIAGSVMAILRVYPIPSHRSELLISKGLGQVAAEEAAWLLAEGGTVAVIAADTSKMKTRGIIPDLTSFQRTLAQEPNIQLVAVEKIPPDQVTGSLWEELPVQFFIGALKRHRRVNVVVFLFGTPPTSDAGLRDLPKPLPQVVAVSYSQVQSKKLLERGTVQVALVYRPPTGKDDTQPRTPRQWFDKLFIVMKSEPTTSLPQ